MNHLVGLSNNTGFFFFSPLWWQVKRVIQVMKLLPSIIKNQDVQFCWCWKLHMQSSYILGGEMEHKGEWMFTLDALSTTAGHVCALLPRLEREPPFSLGLLEAVFAWGGEDLDRAPLQVKSDPQFPWKQRCNKLFSGVAYKFLKMFLVWYNSPLHSALNFIYSPNYALLAPHQKEA